MMFIVTRRTNRSPDSACRGPSNSLMARPALQAARTTSTPTEGH
jgi:hypothetical protein